MEIVTGSTGEAHVTPIDDAVRNSNTGYYGDRVVFDTFRAFEAVAITANEVRVYGGYGMNQGRIFKIDEADYDSCTIENGAQGTKRADLIVARYTMDSQTGFEDISLVVIKGEAGNVYTDPSYTTGNMNEGATQDDFPLYRVKINGIVIEAVEPLFTALPDGGRLGLVEQKIDNHIADTEDPHRLAWTEAQNLVPMSVSDKLNVQFGKIAKAITSLIAHIADKANPHEVSGSQLTGVVPISKGGTGASTAVGALQALGVPSDVANAMSKDVYTDTLTDTIKPAKGGTGRTSWTSGTVLVGNGTAAATERSIDSTTGGIANSSALITSGALNATKAQLQTSFQGGVDTIYNACRTYMEDAYKPSQSTPSAIATAVRNQMQSTVEEYIAFFLPKFYSPLGVATFYLPVQRLQSLYIDSCNRELKVNNVVVSSGYTIRNFQMSDSEGPYAVCKVEMYEDPNSSYIDPPTFKATATYSMYEETDVPIFDATQEENPYQN